MTYTEASIHNTANYKLGTGYRESKEIADGKHHRWVIDPIGRIGYIKKTRPDAILVFYPVKSFKVSVRVCVWSWDANRWNEFKLIEEE